MVGSSVQDTTPPPKKNMALVYGKELYMWEVRGRGEGGKGEGGREEERKEGGGGDGGRDGGGGREGGRERESRGEVVY